VSSFKEKIAQTYVIADTTTAFMDFAGAVDDWSRQPDEGNLEEVISLLKGLEDQEAAPWLTPTSNVAYRAAGLTKTQRNLLAQGRSIPIMASEWTYKESDALKRASQAAGAEHITAVVFSADVTKDTLLVDLSKVATDKRIKKLLDPSTTTKIKNLVVLKEIQVSTANLEWRSDMKGKTND